MHSDLSNLNRKEDDTLDTYVSNVCIVGSFLTETKTETKTKTPEPSHMFAQFLKNPHFVPKYNRKAAFRGVTTTTAGL